MVFRIVIGLILSLSGAYLLLAAFSSGMPTMGEAYVLPSPMEFGTKMLDIGIKAAIFAIGAVILGSGVRAHSTSYAYP